MLRRAAIAGVLLGLLGGAVDAAAYVPAPAACPYAYAVPTAATIVRARMATACLVNAERRRAHRTLLRGNAQLGWAALTHSVDMVRSGYFAHAGPTGSTLPGRLAATGYLQPGRWARYAETLAWGESTRAMPAAAVRAWMASYWHRSVILNPGFRDLGIGIAPGVPMPTPAGSPLPGATYTLNAGVRS